jgi:hypothetical protein
VSRTDSDAARLRRLRRLAARHGLSILAATRPASKAAGGGYNLSEQESRAVLLGDRPAPYSATLDAVEARLLAVAEEGEEGE